MQQTTFPFEIIINDDASTDGTTEIIKEYQEKYPEIIIPIFHKENQYSKGYRSMAARNIFPVARGKYFAMCEGDDYWTDPLKLQKQVDFLERNPGCSCCFHPVQWTYVDGRTPDKIEGPQLPGEKIFPPGEVIGGMFIRIVSLMFRSEVFKVIPDWLFASPNGDLPLQLMCATKGNIGYLGGEVMAVYRRGAEGAWSQNAFGDKKGKIQWAKKALQENIKMLDLFNEGSAYKYNSLIERRKRKNIIRALFTLKNVSGRLGSVSLITKHFDQLLHINDKRVVRFWLHYILGERRGEVLYLKIYSTLKSPSRSTSK